MLEFLNPVRAWEGLQAFLETGGNVLVVIMFATFIMWAFILERLSYWGFAFQPSADRAVRAWEAWKREHPLFAMAASKGRKNCDDSEKRAFFSGELERQRLLSQVRQAAEQNVEVVKILVAIAPMLGLLGTVTGMVEVFDVMAVSGSSNARAMSAGVSKATIPTMAGMVASLSGLFFSNQLERNARDKLRELEDHLTFDSTSRTA